MLFQDKQAFATYEYGISSVIRQFFSSKTIPKTQDGSTSLGLFRKDKTGILKKFHRTDLDI